jgi:hypothetical protein
MLVSQKLAIAAHLHVLLRRKTGRVTDTEWMASNIDYAIEIIRFSRVKALEDGHPELGEWADKLERALLEEKPPGKPLAQTALALLRDRHPAQAPSAFDPGATNGFGPSTLGGESGFSESTLLDPDKPRKPRDPNAPRYVGGIR